MQRGSRRRLLRYSERVADCRGAFTFLDRIRYMERFTRLAVNRASRTLSTATALIR